MPKSKRQHRKGLARAKSMRAGPSVGAVSNTSLTNSDDEGATAATTTAATAAKVQKPYVNPYEEGPEQNAYVEAMRKYGEERAAAEKAKKARALWDDWFRGDPVMNTLDNTKKPIGAWADLMEEEYRKNPDLLKPREAKAAVAVAPANATAAAVAAANATATAVPVPAVRGPVIKKSTKTQLLVGNLPAGITASQLTAAFEPYGTVTNLHIPIDPGTKYTKGFAFVTFSSADEAAAALTGRLIFPNPLKKGPRSLVATLAYAEGKPKSKGAMRAREI